MLSTRYWDCYSPELILRYILNMVLLICVNLSKSYDLNVPLTSKILATYVEDNWGGCSSELILHLYNLKVLDIFFVIMSLGASSFYSS
jgi:hypothetical protein